MPNRFVAKLRSLVDLAEGDVRALKKATEDATLIGPRKDLIREGDKPGPVFVMLEGWAARYKILPGGTRQIMAFLMPGDDCDLHAGVMSQMDHGIQTLTRAHVATISRTVMDDLMAKHPGIARAMYVAQLVNEGTLRAWIVSLGRRSSIERITQLLLELHIRGLRTGLATENVMEMPLSQVVLADALGVTPVHVNRMLQELRRSGAVELRRGMLRLTDPAALVRISGFDENFLHRRLEQLSTAV